MEAFAGSGSPTVFRILKQVDNVFKPIVSSGSART